MRWLEKGDWVDVEIMRCVLRVWVWGSLLHRPLLAAPHAVFDMAVKHEGQVTLWWPSARREWNAMRGLLPFMEATLNTPCATAIFA